MWEKLIQLDTKLFLWLNGHHNPFWDHVMIFVSGKLEWVPLYLILFGYVVYKYKRKSIWIFLSIAIMIALSDTISTRLIKETIERLRPTHNPELEGLVHIVKGKGGYYGFVSSHASNTFALATFLSLLIRKNLFTLFIFLWAALVSYSRIYLGVHYPADILGGAVIGILIAFLIHFIYKKLIARYAEKSTEKHD